MADIAFCRGNSIHDNQPKLVRVADFEAFFEAIDQHRAPKKESAGYICGPLNGTGLRCAEGATARNWLALDIDRIDPAAYDDLRMWFTQFEGAAWPTHSSTAERPRLRVLVMINRDATREECMDIGRALVRAIGSKFGTAVVVDPSTFRGEQPIFFPPTAVPLARYFGEPIDAAAYLAVAAKLPKPAAAGLPKGGEKVTANRNEFLSQRAYPLARSGIQGEALVTVVQMLNRQHCEPPLPDDEVRGIALRKNIVPKEAPTPVVTFSAGKTPPPEPAEKQWPNLLLSEKGAILPCEHNAFELLAHAEPYEGLYFDEFLSRMRIGERDWIDGDDLDAARWLQITYRVAKFNLAQARNGARALAYARRRDSLREYFEALPAWDGIERIHDAFTDAWGAPDDELTRAASGNFFIACAARAMRPGAQVDTLWTFEGPQGGYKSRSLRELGQHLHAEISAPIGSTDFQRELRGVLIAELSELDSLRGKEASTIKRLLSAPADRFVQKYENHAQSYPRRAVSVATTNEANYWQDSTGARRLVPIACGEIRIDLIQAQRLQWFAEALQRFISGESWWEFPASIAFAQEDRQQGDLWEDQIRYCIEHGKLGMTWPTGPVTTSALMREWLDIPTAQQGTVSGVRLSKIMRRLGFTPVRIGASQQRAWKKQ